MIPRRIEFIAIEAWEEEVRGSIGHSGIMRGLMFADQNCCSVNYGLNAKIHACTNSHTHRTEIKLVHYP